MQKLTSIHLLIIKLTIPELQILLKADFKSFASELFLRITSYGDSSESLSSSDLKNLLLY